MLNMLRTNNGDIPMRFFWLNAMRAIVLAGLYGVHLVVAQYNSIEWLLLMLVVSGFFLFLFVSSFNWLVIGRRIEYHFLRINERVWHWFDRRQQRRVR